jgi:hypothetical protein
MSLLPFGEAGRAIDALVIAGEAEGGTPGILDASVELRTMTRHPPPSSWLRTWALLSATAGVVAACTLNPQPLPPDTNGDSGTTEGPGTADAARDVGNGHYDAAGADVVLGEEAGSAPDGAFEDGESDADASDAEVDGSSDAPSDAPSDARPDGSDGGNTSDAESH